MIVTKKIVIVEDDQRLSDLLREKLTRFQFDVVCHDGSSDLLFLIEKESPSLILLDVNLPSFDGFYWCNQIRLKTTCPILFISARDSNQDQVRALENGGDDYITKPFATDLLVAKVRSHLRRSYGAYAETKEQAIICEELILYKKKLLVEFKQERSPLSYKEANLLELVMSSYPEVVDRKKILATLWDESEFIDENTLSVNVTRVRKQLNSIKAPHQIIAVRGVGYRLKVGEP
ncbi:two-component response regulator YvcP [Bacillus sp. JCM 19045]|nr:two-component response regulator YvcP [Bacillus sp. JCM 19045]